jgi:hypothetical protein
MQNGGVDNVISDRHVLASWDLPCRRRILRQEWDVSRVFSTMYLWKICYLNIWCNLEFWTIWKCVHTMNLNIIKYFAIWVYMNIIMWISCMNLNPLWISSLWILYEFEFEISPIHFGRFNCSLNLYILNGVGWLKVPDTIDPSLVSTS